MLPTCLSPQENATEVCMITDEHIHPNDRSRLARWGVGLVPFGIVLLHFATLPLPFVNQESAFNLATKYFISGDGDLILRFFSADANTVVVSAIGALISEALRFDPDYGCRILSILSAALLAVSIPAMLPSRAGFADKLCLQIIILLSPLIWTYSGRGTADFPPVAFMMAVIALLWSAKERTYGLIALGSASFALAAVMKYHAALVLPFVALGPHAIQTTRFRVLLTASAGVATAFALIGYNTAIHHFFGFWITSPHFLVQLGFQPQNFVNNFIRCGGYLAILALPFSLSSAINLSSLSLGTKCGAIIAGTLAGLFLPPMAGELGFGPFDRWIGDYFSGVILSGMFVVLLISFLEIWSRREHRPAIVSILIFIATLSFSRPAQRYLMFVLPFYFLLLSRGQIIRRQLVPVICVYLMLSVFISLNQFDSIRSVPKDSTLEPTPTIVHRPSFK
jgi:hypothetical protein